MLMTYPAHSTAVPQCTLGTRCLRPLHSSVEWSELLLAAPNQAQTIRQTGSGSKREVGGEGVNRAAGSLVKSALLLSAVVVHFQSHGRLSALVFHWECGRGRAWGARGEWESGREREAGNFGGHFTFCHGNAKGVASSRKLLRIKMEIASFSLGSVSPSLRRCRRRRRCCCGCCRSPCCRRFCFTFVCLWLQVFITAFITLPATHTHAHLRESFIFIGRSNHFGPVSCAASPRLLVEGAAQW